MKIKIITMCLLIFSVSFSACDKGGEGKKEIYETLEDGEGSAEAQSEAVKSDSVGTTQITFAESEHDFGTIDEGVVASHIFKFTNTGKSPLIISDARADCGCTVPSWTKEPILPGKEGQIEVKYSSANRGGQTVSKTVTVLANTEPSDNKLTIKAKVRAKGGSPLKNQN